MLAIGGWLLAGGAYTAGPALTEGKVDSLN